jgi:hypothetical protein
MSIRFLTPARHGVVDYLAAAELLILPFVLGLGTSSPLPSGSRSRPVWPSSS